jgi:hypothetical protein
LEILMKKMMFGIVLSASFVSYSVASDANDMRKDAVRHRAMAAAHEAAAQCLESGKAHDTCGKNLQAACKGLAIGKYCGMKHAH